jgi:hypothetical protein
MRSDRDILICCPGGQTDDWASIGRNTGYCVLRVYALQAAAFDIDTRYGSSGAHSPVVYMETGGRRGRFERLAPAGVKAAGTGGPGSGSAGTSGALRVGVIEPGMEPGGHLVVELWPGPGQVSARHGGAQLCSLQRRAHPLRVRPIHGSPGGWQPNVTQKWLSIYITRSKPHPAG